MSASKPALTICILVLALALGLACETGERATDEDIEAIAKALSDSAPTGSGPEANSPVLWPFPSIRNVEALLNEGADINAKDSNGDTLLHKAALHAGPDVIELLIAEGADIEAADERGNTPLHAAAQHGDATTVVALLDAGAKVNAANTSGETPLYFAAVEAGYISVTEASLKVEALLDRGADPNANASRALALANPEIQRLMMSYGADPNSPAGGLLPIHGAAEQGDVAMVEFWLNNGADVNATEEFGQTPLHFAVGRLFRPGEPAPPATFFMGVDMEESQALAVVQLLLNRGATVDVVASDAVGSWGLTPLLKAAELGRAEIVRLLLDHGANVHARDSSDNTILTLGSEADPRVMQLLIDRQVLVTFDAQTASDACQEASLGSDPSPAKLLLSEHCVAAGLAGTPSDVVSSEPTEGETPTPPTGPVSAITPHLRVNRMEFNLQWVTETPLHRAVVEGNTALVQASLAQGADVNAQATIRLTGHGSDVEWTGMTPLHLAALNPDPAVTQALLVGGANVNARAQHGLTPLHTAARFGARRHAQALVDGGAQVEARDDDGRTPLHWSLEGDPNIPGLLLDLGADIEAKNKDGFTPLHWAAIFVDLEGAAFFLVEQGADITATDNMGRTPCQVYFAANQGLGTSGMIELLCPVRSGPGPMSVNRFLSVSVGEEMPLHKTALDGTVSEVQAILDQGADVNSAVRLTWRDDTGPTSWEEVTPLHLAVMNPDPAVAALFLNRGADIEAMDWADRTPLIVAVMWFPNPAVITLLLDRGANIEALDYNWMSPLFLAAQQASIHPSPSIDEGHQAIIALLLDRGAEIGPGGEQILCNTVYGVPNFDEELRGRFCGQDS